MCRKWKLPQASISSWTYHVSDRLAHQGFQTVAENRGIREGPTLCCKSAWLDILSEEARQGLQRKL